MERGFNDLNRRTNYLFEHHKMYSPGSEFENTENIDPIYTQQKTFSPLQTDIGSPIRPVPRYEFGRAM